MNTTVKTQFVPMLSFGQCITLIQKLVEKGVMHNPPLSAKEPDKPDTNHVLIYMDGDELNPEGWYSMNILEVASDLANDYGQQRELRDSIADIDVDVDGIEDPTNLWNETSDALSDLAGVDRFKHYNYDIIGIDKNGEQHKYCTNHAKDVAVYAADSICHYEKIGKFADGTNPDGFITNVIIVDDNNTTIYDSNMKG